MKQRPRETRLANEFKLLLAVISPHNLFQVWCGDLRRSESSEFLRTSMSVEVIMKGLAGMFTPDEFQKRFPDQGPEKYIVSYSCTGLVRQQSDMLQSNFHLMEIVYGLDYPSRPPVLVWFTNIWHPNFDPPYVCDRGRPFAPGRTLAQQIVVFGQMVQYRNYNLDSVLNAAARDWAKENESTFPIDHRDIVDARRTLATYRPQVPNCDDSKLVTLMDMEPLESLVQLTEEE